MNVFVTLIPTYGSRINKIKGSLRGLRLKNDLALRSYVRLFNISYK